jgi:NADH:ubiquinone oxidoreductase subunit E
MIVTICVGSSCHLKGSREIITRLETLISENKLKNKVELNGAFCMGQCVKGVCVKLDGEPFSLTPKDTDSFFHGEILRRLT